MGELHIDELKLAIITSLLTWCIGFVLIEGSKIWGAVC
jgi:hypothetical protein